MTKSKHTVVKFIEQINEPTKIRFIDLPRLQFSVPTTIPSEARAQAVAMASRNLKAAGYTILSVNNRSRAEVCIIVCRTGGSGLTKKIEGIVPRKKQPQKFA
jgi:hypothetical protein